MSALMAAYQHGAHVDLVYDEEGKAKLGGEGENVVEYIRCGAWEWVPVSLRDTLRLESI